MRIWRWVQIVTLAASWYNMGAIWMAQVSWRLFARVGREDFPAYHRAWWFGPRGIQPVVFPFGIVAILGAFAQLRWHVPRTPTWMAWLNIGFLVTVWGATAAWWGRQQAQMEYVYQEDHSLNPLYQRLLATHWIRVALITASALLQIGMAVASARETTSSGEKAPTDAHVMAARM